MCSSELDFLSRKDDVAYIMEEFITAQINSYDAIINGLLDVHFKGPFTLEAFCTPVAQSFYFCRRKHFTQKGPACDRLAMPPLDFKLRSETLMLDMTRYMLNSYGAIAISIAQNIGADPHAVLMAIAVAASCAFATPVGTPPNTLVLGPGGYKFFDYVKAGTPLVVVSFIVSLIIIPIVWPFFP